MTLSTTTPTTDPAAKDLSADPGALQAESMPAGPTADGGAAAVTDPLRIVADRLATFWREWLRPFLLILLVLLTIRSVIADWNHVPSGSMKPSILEGDRIFVNKLAYDLRWPFTTHRITAWSEPRHGDIVVFLSPTDGKRLVKRVVAVPGDDVELRRHRLWVDGRPARYQRIAPESVDGLEPDERGAYRLADESIEGGDPHPIMTRAWLSTRSSFGPITLGPDEFFVMGDNRDDSADSRVFGPVPRRLILGRATAVATSVDPARRFQPRWSRFFTALR